MENNELYLRFLETSKRIGIPIKKIIDLLFILVSKGSIDNNVLVRKTGVSTNVLNKVKKDLSFLLEPTSDKTKIKEEMIENIKKIYSNYKVEEFFWKFLEDNSYNEIVNILDDYFSFRPNPRRDLDQFFATIETTAKRAKLMDFFADIKRKRILFIGDDDLTSIAVSILGSAKRVTVLDIDNRLLELIKKISEEKKLGIETFPYDARKKLDKSLCDKFDVVFTDPPYTIKGMNLFLSRAVDAIDKKNLAGRIYACYGNSDRAKERFLPIYKLFLDLGLMVRWIFDKFNRYEGAVSIGSSSSLFVCEVTPQADSNIKGEYEGTIYTNN